MPFQANVTYNLVGGNRSAACYSGQVAPTLTGAYSGVNAVITGPDVMLQSGKGRLIAVVPHQSVLSLSGVAVSIYDAVAPVSGGPVITSGHSLIAAPGAPWGVSGQMALAGVPITLNVPFTSGLCFNSRSGQVGMTFYWQSEANIA